MTPKYKMTKSTSLASAREARRMVIGMPACQVLTRDPSKSRSKRMTADSRPYPLCVINRGALTPLTNAKGKPIGPLPATSQDRERASIKFSAVTRPEPIKVSPSDILLNKVPGKRSKSQRVPPTNAKNTAEVQATKVLRVSRHASNPAKTMERASVSPRARSSAVHGAAEETRMN